MSLTYIAQQFTIYSGYILLIGGVLGNGLNIFVFLSVRIYRRNPSTFYIVIGSITNICYLIINLTIRIISVGYGYDPSLTSHVLCKARSFFIGTLPLISFSCSCLSTIDQFFSTSQNVRLRNFSKLKLAHRIVLIIIIISFIHGIPILFYYDISIISNRCTSINIIYRTYVPIYILVLLLCIPVLIMSIFGWLTYLNIHRTIRVNNQRVDRQLTIMILMQVILVIISMIPFGIFNTYILITNGKIKNINQQLNEYITDAILRIVSYLFYVGNFYMFFISSSRFRRIVIHRILCWRKPIQVLPHLIHR